MRLPSEIADNFGFQYEPAIGGRRASAVPVTTKEVTGIDSKAENHAFQAK